jgi:hypothetical protein
MQERASSARYRSGNPQRSRDAVRASKESKRDIIREAKNQPCVDCGVKYPYYVMDLDHVRGKKLLSVGLMVAWGYTEAEILAEISKCDPVCANCHRERTYRPK